MKVSTGTLTRFLTAVVIVMGWSMGRAQGLGAQESCTITQLTDAAGATPEVRSRAPAINADGTHIAFESRADLTGQNADGSEEIFLFDTTTDSLAQVTAFTPEEGFGDSLIPAINADGTRIAFASGTDLTGQNADGNVEIFVFDTTTNAFTQLTDSALDNRAPAINADGTRIAFESNADLSGQNADGSEEIFLFDTTTNALTQVTAFTPEGGFFLLTGFSTINADGTRIAFESNADLTGQNADGNIEIFLFDTTTDALTQVTAFEGSFRDSRFPTINADGTRIAFESRADLTGQNADGNTEIFLFDTTTNAFTQVTDSTLFSFSPSINADGTRIAFGSVADLSGQNTDGSPEIFLFDTTTNAFTQLTDSTLLGGVSPIPTINTDGTRVAFNSEADLTGQNADGSEEIFLATCPSRGVLENPQPDSFQSGISVISGWVCSASVVEIEFDGDTTFEAAYGTSRADTVGVCGDANNGFSLLVNWNLLGDGEHTVRVLADGVEVASVTVTVMTLGLGEFPTGLSGAFTLIDFPAASDETSIQWQQSQQNFVIVSGSASGGGNSGSGGQVLEIPQPGAFQSGIGGISGFVCDATVIEIEFNGTSAFEAAYGTSRGDSQGVCGDTNNGFSLLFNWNLLGDGMHTVRALADGVEFANVTITVTTLGLGEFPTGLSGEFMLPDFPQVGTETSIQWQQSQQNFAIVDVQ